MRNGKSIICIFHIFSAAATTTTTTGITLGNKDFFEKIVTTNSLRMLQLINRGSRVSMYCQWYV
jgi:hypothetical protein